MSHRTRDDDGHPIPEKKPRKRKKRPNLIGNSKHRNTYHLLMQDGWSSTHLSFYADHYFGESIAASTFRSYRSRRGWPARRNPANVRDPDNERLQGWRHDYDNDVPIDVFHERAELVRLQQLRVAIAVSKEVRVGELDPTTRLEVQALSKLLSEVADDMRVMGLLPGSSSGDDVGAVRENPGPSGDSGEGVSAPVWARQSFGEVVADLQPEAEMLLARSLQEAGLLGPGNGHVNGQVVDGEVE